MGACQHCQHVQETATHNEVKANIEQVEKVAEPVVEDLGAVEDQVRFSNAYADTGTTQAKEAVETNAEEMVAENAADAPAVEVIADMPRSEESVEKQEASEAHREENTDNVETKQEECEQVAEAKPEEEAPEQKALEEEAPEQKALVTQLVFEFAKKGQAHKTVEFVYKPLGFDFEDSKVKTRCAPCGRSSKGPVKVSAVEDDQQAATLGVELDAIIYKVNGKDVADSKQLRDLIKDHWLPDKAACN